MKLWIVGQIREEEMISQWELQGVFDSESQAVSCTGNRWGFFVAPIILNEVLPEQSVEWEGLYYPYDLN